MFTGSSSLKFYKRLQVYKNSTGTVEYNPLARRARSYGWTFLEPVNGTLVFNTYTWSPTTSCHQSAVQSVLRQSLGTGQVIFLDLGPIAPSYFNKDKARSVYRSIVNLRVLIEICPKGTRVAGYRESEVKEKLEALTAMNKIKPETKLSDEEMIEIEEQVFETTFNEMMEKQGDKRHKQMMMKLAQIETNEIVL